MVLIDMVTAAGQIGHALAVLVLLLLCCIAMLWAWVLVLLLLPGCRRRQPQVKGGAGYLPGPAPLLERHARRLGRHV